MVMFKEKVLIEYRHRNLVRIVVRLSNSTSCILLIRHYHVFFFIQKKSVVEQMATYKIPSIQFDWSKYRESINNIGILLICAYKC